MRVGALVARESASRYMPIGVHGQPVSDAHVTLRAALLQRFGPAHAACFARPDRDPRDETIGWIAEVAGEARRWTDLPPDEQLRRSLDLESYRGDLLAYARELREGAAGAPGGDSAARSIAALLEQAIIVPDETHVHFIGDQPVLSFWGFRQADGSGVVGLGLAPPAASPAAAAVAAPIAAGATPVVAAAPWWRRLLWLVPLLLVMAFLLLWLLWGRGCAALDPILPVLPDADRLETPVPVEPGPGVVPVLPDGRAGPAGPSVGIVPGPTAPAGDPSPPPGSEAMPAENPTPPPDTPADQPPATEPPPAEAPPPEPPLPESPPAESPPAEPPPAEAPPAGPPLEIPPEAASSGDVGFLDGLWRSQQGLVDNVTGEALEQRYRFGSDGTGEAVVRRSDGVECRGPVRGRFVDGRLVLEEEGSLTCPDGRTYDPSVTRCERTASGLTVCRGANPDGTGYRVELEKIP